MITVPPDTDNPDPAGTGRVVATVAVAHHTADPRPYVPEIPEPTVGETPVEAPAEPVCAGGEPGCTADEGGPCKQLTEAWPDDVDTDFEAAVTAHAERLRDVIDDAEIERRRDVVDQVTSDDPGRRAILAGPNGTAPSAATGEQPTVEAGNAQRGMLLSHMEHGENVGLEIRHVEPYVDGSGVTIVMAGGFVEHYPVDVLLEVVDPAEAREARARLAAKQRTAGQVDVLHHIAALAESAELPVPYHLRVEGDLPTLELLHSAADVLGAEAVEESPGFWRVDCRFGADEKYTAPVELSLTHYASSYGRGQS